MFSIDDQPRFLTEYRYGQLLAEAEGRRLVADDLTASATVRTSAIDRLRTWLFSQRRSERTAAVPADTVAVAPSPAPMAGRLDVAGHMVASAATDDRTGSVAKPCGGPCVHEQAAA
jgi:hypothetical protein